jgi:hypothetical protein
MTSVHHLPFPSMSTHDTSSSRSLFVDYGTSCRRSFPPLRSLARPMHRNASCVRQDSDAEPLCYRSGRSRYSASGRVSGRDDQAEGPGGWLRYRRAEWRRGERYVRSMLSLPQRLKAALKGFSGGCTGILPRYPQFCSLTASRSISQCAARLPDDRTSFSSYSCFKS